MKKLPILTLIALITILTLSAGCIGTQTTDIVIGDKTVGTIQIIPVEDNTYDLKIKLFGIEFSKNDITQNEAADLTSKIENGNIQLTDFIALQFPENLGEPSDLNDFIDSIKNMPITNIDTQPLGESFSLSNTTENANQSISNLENLIAEIFNI